MAPWSWATNAPRIIDGARIGALPLGLTASPQDIWRKRKNEGAFGLSPKGGKSE